MNIAIINRLMGIFRGGGENFDLNLGRTLRGLGCHVQFVVGRRISRIDFPLQQFPITYIATPYLRGLMYWGEKVGRHPALGLGFRASRLDLLLFELAAFHQIKKWDLSEVDLFQLCAMPRLAAWLEKYLHKPASVIWPGPIGNDMATFREKYSLNIGQGDGWPSVCKIFPKAFEVAYGVDSRKFQPIPDPDRSRIRRQMGFSDKHVVLLFVGRLIGIKNLSFLIKGFAAAYKSNPNLRLLIVGSGPDEGHLKRLAQDLHIAEMTIWCGMKFEDSLIEMYNAADIFCICSNYESFSAVTLEAMAVKLPIIATKVGFLPHLVKENENGFLIESNNIMELKTAILKLAKNKEMRQTLGVANRDNVINNYEWDNICIKVLNKYKEICTKSYL
jgi:glycosyltransferase involved in cell wall biosynthesis